MKILFFCAHPDDLEFEVPSVIIAAGRDPDLENLKVSIRKLDRAIDRSREFLLTSPSNADIKLKVACMTRGEMSSFTYITKSTKKAAKIRTAELNESQNVLSGESPDYLGFFDGYVSLDEKTISTIEDYIVGLKPDIIIAPEPIYTWYHHRDHIRTGKAAFLALKRIKLNIKTGGVKMNLPSLYYFQSIWNDWYFPKYRIFKKVIDRALKAHRSQAGLLRFAKILGFFESFIHGRNVPDCFFAEALRHQAIPDQDGKLDCLKIRRLAQLSWLKRIIYYVSKRIYSMEIEDYKGRSQHLDGTIDPDFSKEW